jgi:hypothetical protein
MMEETVKKKMPYPIFLHTYTRLVTFDNIFCFIIIFPFKVKETNYSMCWKYLMAIVFRIIFLLHWE